MPQRPRKFIIVTGGVCSGLGKGITAASIGTLLSKSGLSVTPKKLEAYLNVDPGTMNPFRHGEVFVTADGAETDLDLGHYERFLDQDLTRVSAVTTGQLYKKVLERERNGDYHGEDVQIIPHLTNAIKEEIRRTGDETDADVITVEIGGTVGDIECEPYLEAVRQLHSELGSVNVLFVHVVLVPYLKASKELKSKPAQASVRELRRIGIKPDVIVARADEPIPVGVMKKISLFGDVPLEAVIPAVTAPSIYDVPLEFADLRLLEIIAKQLDLGTLAPDLSAWVETKRRIREAKPAFSVAIVGKYEMEDAYISVTEAIKSACYHSGVKPDVRLINSERLEAEGAAAVLDGIGAIVVAGGYGTRGTEGKILAAQYAREHDIPYLGLCLGMQILTMEFARNVAGIENATSEEFNPDSDVCVIALMEAQKQVTMFGGTNRLGAYDCKLDPASIAGRLYGTELISERHRHRYEFNNAFRPQLEAAGLRIAGVNTELNLVEIVEIADHPYMVGSQFHPEFTSRPTRPNPLFLGLVQAAKARVAAGKLAGVIAT